MNRKSVVKVEVRGFKRMKGLTEEIFFEKLPVKVAEGHLKQIKKNLLPSVKTGNLRNSFKIRVRKGIYTITSNMPYARIQDKGGNIRITEKMRKKMWLMFKETKNPLYKAIALTKKTYVTIPPKHYTETTNKNYLIGRAKREAQKLINNSKLGK